MKRNKFIFLFCLGLLYLLFYSGKPKDNNLSKPVTNDDYNTIAINEIRMWIANNGDGSHDPITDGSGFYWPGGKLATKAAIFEDGLLWGCIIGEDTVVNGNTHRQGLQAGKILPGGSADHPGDRKYRVYKVLKWWQELQPGPERDNYERDYNEWPVEDGAPWVDADGDGIYTSGIDEPDFSGDQMLWYIANDLDTSRSQHTYESDPIGLEFQTLVYGYNKTNFLKDVVFKKYLIINKGNHQIDSMYVSYWSDDDLGDATDDFVGCDTLLNLGYTYNGDNSDGDGKGISYGVSPPAVGHMIVQGPVSPGSPGDSARFQNKWISGYTNLSMTSFMNIFPSSWWDPWPWGANEMYNFMKGFIWNGFPITDPHTGLITKFVVPGDPVAGVGWYEGIGWPGGENPGDRRSMISSGPFTMAPGDSQEVEIAILIARGTNYLDSITELKKKAQLVHAAYQSGFKAAPEMEKPATKGVPTDQSLTLYWETNAEDFGRRDQSSQNQDANYIFEGYRVWQYRDLNGTDPTLLATYDIENNVDLIYDQMIVNGHPATVVAIDGPNMGLKRSIDISESTYDQKPLNNANPYYFAVTAYSYSALSDPSYIESHPEIIEVVPGLQKIDETHLYDSGENIIADHISGYGDGTVELMVVDPDALSGEEYQVVFKGEGRNAAYSFINITSNDTLISNCTDFSGDTLNSEIIDGFFLKVENQGWQEIYDALRERNYAVKDLLETNGPNGFPLDSPVNIFGNQNSTGNWQISSYGVFAELLQNINISDQIGYQNYEIRFTSTGSEYYLTGSDFGFTPWTKDDPKASDRVPFEIWDIGTADSESDDFRLSIKTLDDYASLKSDSNFVDQDGKWSQLENGDWEPIFAFFQDSVYQEPLPETSGRISTLDIERSRLGKIIIRGDLPAEGTVIRINTWKPLSAGDVFSVIASASKTNDYEAAKTSLNDISVFPNPFYGFGTLSGYIKQDFMRFINLPTQVTVRIFSLSGVYVRRIEKNDNNPYLDWDLKNNAGELVASGIYIAHLEMPNIGEKVMKLAVIMENQY